MQDGADGVMGFAAARVAFVKYSFDSKPLRISRYGRDVLPDRVGGVKPILLIKTRIKVDVCPS